MNTSLPLDNEIKNLVDFNKKGHLELNNIPEKRKITKTHKFTFINTKPKPKPKSKSKSKPKSKSKSDKIIDMLKLLIKNSKNESEIIGYLYYIKNIKKHKTYLLKMFNLIHNSIKI
jgi:hypothetical protein